MTDTVRRELNELAFSSPCSVETAKALVSDMLGRSEPIPTDALFSYFRIAVRDLPGGGLLDDDQGRFELDTPAGHTVTYTPSGLPIYVDCKCGEEYALWVRCDCPNCGSSAVALVYDRPAKPTMKLLKSLCQDATNGGTIYTARKTGFDGEIAIRQYINGSLNAEYFTGDVLDAIGTLAAWVDVENREGR